MKITNADVVQFTIASSASSGTGTVSGFTDADNMVVWATERVPANGSSMHQDDHEVDVYVTNTTTITAERTASPAWAVTVRAYVVQFDSNTNVYKGTWSMASGETSDVVSIGGTVVLADTFGWHHTEGDTQGNGSDADWPGNVSRTRMTFTTTNVTIDRNTSGSIVNGHWFVVENTDLFVQQVNDTHNAASTPPTDTFGTAVTLADTMFIESYKTTSDQYGADDAYTCAQLTGTTTASFYYGGGLGDSQTRTYFVVEDSEFDVQRGRFTNTTTSANTSITSVTLANSIAKHGSGRPFSTTTNDFDIAELDTKAHEVWLSAANTINVESGVAGGGSVSTTWEVVEFQVEVASARRVFLIS